MSKDITRKDYAAGFATTKPEQLDKNIRKAKTKIRKWIREKEFQTIPRPSDSFNNFTSSAIYVKAHGDIDSVVVVTMTKAILFERDGRDIFVENTPCSISYSNTTELYNFLSKYCFVDLGCWEDYVL